MWMQWLAMVKYSLLLFLNMLRTPESTLEMPRWSSQLRILINKPWRKYEIFVMLLARL
jgi:hypothetical protein